MTMMVIAAASLIFTSFLITLELVAASDISQQVFGIYVLQEPARLEQADVVTKTLFCEQFIPQL